MNPADPHLAKTRLLDFDAPSIAKLIEERGWAELHRYNRIGAIYDFVRNEIAFGYNRAKRLCNQPVADTPMGRLGQKHDRDLRI